MNTAVQDELRRLETELTQKLEAVRLLLGSAPPPTSNSNMEEEFYDIFELIPHGTPIKFKDLAANAWRKWSYSSCVKPAINRLEVLGKIKTWLSGPDLLIQRTEPPDSRPLTKEQEYNNLPALVVANPVIGKPKSVGLKAFQQIPNDTPRQREFLANFPAAGQTATMKDLNALYSTKMNMNVTSVHTFCMRLLKAGYITRVREGIKYLYSRS